MAAMEEGPSYLVSLLRSLEPSLAVVIRAPLATEEPPSLSPASNPSTPRAVRRPGDYPVGAEC